LLPSIKAKPGSRVVTLSSGASHQGKIDFDNLQSERVYKPMFRRMRNRSLPTSSFRRNAAAVDSRRMPDHQHGRSPWIRGDESSADHVGAGLTLLMAVMNRSSLKMRRMEHYRRSLLRLLRRQFRVATTVRTA